MITLDRELESAVARLMARPDAKDIVERAGIPVSALIVLELSYDHDPLGLEKIATEGSHYQPAEDGREALILPVADGDLLDLIAWFPDEPGRWWRRTGIPDILGEEAVRISRHTGERLRLHANPRDWLRDSGYGAVVLDWRGAWEWLPQLDRILVDDRHLYREVERVLAPYRRPPPAPEVKIAGAA